jgi:hypothetical protein
MNQNKRTASIVFLILGISFVTIGLATDNAVFSWLAIAFVVIALILSGRPLRPGKR